MDCIVIGNPNNPTGTLATADEVLALAEVGARKGTDILVDESFLDFLPSDEAYSVLDQAGDRDNLFVIRSMTKFYALPGLRLGFGVTSPLRRGLMEGIKTAGMSMSWLSMPASPDSGTGPISRLRANWSRRRKTGSMNR